MLTTIQEVDTILYTASSRQRFFQARAQGGRDANVRLKDRLWLVSHPHPQLDLVVHIHETPVTTNSVKADVQFGSVATYATLLIT
jgi:hypothetical protein